MKLIISYVALFSFIFCNGQNQNHYERVDKLLTYFFKDDVSNNKIMFTIDDKFYLLIIEKKDAYEHYYFQVDTITDKKPEVKQIILFKPNDLLEKAFNTNNYHTGYIDYFSDFYKDGVEFKIGNPTYFVFIDKNGQKFGEAELSTTVTPNPIDKKVYDYLVKIMIEMMSD